MASTFLAVFHHFLECLLQQAEKIYTLCIFCGALWYTMLKIKHGHTNSWNRGYSLCLAGHKTLIGIRAFRLFVPPYCVHSSSSVSLQDVSSERYCPQHFL